LLLVLAMLGMLMLGVGIVALAMPILRTRRLLLLK
jgi:hypothetical protein